MPNAAVHDAPAMAIEAVWRDRWGLPVVTPTGAYMPGDVEGIILIASGKGLAALVTWVAAGDAAEIISLDSMFPGRGHGTRVLDEAEARLRGRGAARMTVATSNDNLAALAFYQKRGYRLVRVHHRAMDLVRSLKPGVPEIGLDGIPLCDMWELEKPL